MVLTSSITCSTGLTVLVTYEAAQPQSGKTLPLSVSQGEQFRTRVRTTGPNRSDYAHKGHDVLFLEHIQRILPRVDPSSSGFHPDRVLSPSLLRDGI